MSLKKKLLFPHVTDSVVRNDSTRIIQPEVVHPMRSESHGSPNGPIERKGTVAIGQSIIYTDFPPKKYGHSGKNFLRFFFLSYTIPGVRFIFLKFTCIVSHIKHAK